MAVISEVKCGRCDRRYSGFRSRCPYCGARRNKRGKHADDRENTRAKLLVGVLLLVVLIGATMVLIFTSQTDKTGSAASTSDSPVASSDAAPALSDDEAGNIAVVNPSGNADASASPEESASPSIDSNVKITSVAITNGGSSKSDVTMVVGEAQTFKFTTTPESTGKVAIWDSGDNSVFVVTDGKVTAMGKGTATLKVTVDGVSAKCVIRVKAK